MNKDIIFNNLHGNINLSLYTGGLSTPLQKGRVVPSIQLIAPRFEACSLQRHPSGALVAGCVKHPISIILPLQQKKPLLHHFDQINITKYEGEL